MMATVIRVRQMCTRKKTRVRRVLLYTDRFFITKTSPREGGNTRKNPIDRGIKFGSVVEVRLAVFTQSRFSYAD